jgi:hypothetical protein
MSSQNHSSTRSRPSGVGGERLDDCAEHVPAARLSKVGEAEHDAAAARPEHTIKEPALFRIIEANQRHGAVTGHYGRSGQSSLGSKYSPSSSLLTTTPATM